MSAARRLATLQRKLADLLASAALVQDEIAKEQARLAANDVEDPALRFVAPLQVPSEIDRIAARKQLEKRGYVRRTR